LLIPFPLNNLFLPVGMVSVINVTLVLFAVITKDFIRTERPILKSKRNGTGVEWSAGLESDVECAALLVRFFCGDLAGRFPQLSAGNRTVKAPGIASNGF
jgi:hypothetical protein